MSGEQQLGRLWQRVAAWSGCSWGASRSCWAEPERLHQPSYSEGEYSDAESAWPITDIDLSVVSTCRVRIAAALAWL